MLSLCAVTLRCHTANHNPKYIDRRIKFRPTCLCCAHGVVRSQACHSLSTDGGKDGWRKEWMNGCIEGMKGRNGRYGGKGWIEGMDGWTKLMFVSHGETVV